MCYKIIGKDYDVPDIWDGIVGVRNGVYDGILVQCTDHEQVEKLRYLMFAHFPDVSTCVQLTPLVRRKDYEERMVQYKSMWE